MLLAFDGLAVFNSQSAPKLSFYNRQDGVPSGRVLISTDSRGIGYVYEVQIFETLIFYFTRQAGAEKHG